MGRVVTASASQALVGLSGFLHVRHLEERPLKLVVVVFHSQSVSTASGSDTIEINLDLLSPLKNNNLPNELEIMCLGT